jgi:hypothetical protein
MSGSNWVNAAGNLASSDVELYRLPPAHASGISSITLTLDTSSSAALVAWQDTIDETSANNYYNLSRTNAPINGGTIWGTDLHSYTGVDQSIAVFISGQPSPENGDIASYDQSFNELADTDIVGTTSYAKYRIWLAGSNVSSMANNGVTATLAPNFTVLGSTHRVGMIAYKRVALTTKPIASAGPSQSVAPNQTVTLDGSASYDPNGTIASYTWAQTSGPAVTLSDIHASQPTFTSLAGGTSYGFELVVTDNDGENSDPATTSVTTGVLRLLKSYAGSSPAISHVINFDTPSNPGTDIFVIAMSTAVIATPSGFIALRGYTDQTDTKIFHMPAADNLGTSSIILTQSASRPLAAVVMDDLAKVRNFVTAKSTNISGGATSWQTDVESFGQSDESIVFYTYEHDDIPTDLDVLSYSNGYTEISDTGSAGSGGAGNQSVRIFVARKSSATLAGQSVTATMSAGYNGYKATHGFIAYDRLSPSPTVVSSYNNDVRPPEGTWYVNQGPLTLGATFTVDSPVKQLTKWRFYYRPEMGALQAALWTASGSSTPLTTEPIPSDTTTGWREVALAIPVDLVNGTSYIVGYYSVNMSFYSDIGGFPALHYGNDDLGDVSLGTVTNRAIYTSAHMYAAAGNITRPDNIAANGRSYYIDFVVDNAQSITAPVANAGNDQAVLVGKTVTLNGSGSSDANGTIASYQWTQVSGPAVVLSDTTSSQPTFTAPMTPGTLTFSLVVTDNDGETSNTDLVVVNVLVTPTIVEENSNTTGVLSRNYWHDGVGQIQMPGFVRKSYYLPGETAEFSIDYNATFTFEVWRMGYYGGSTNGARQVVGPTGGFPTNQPESQTIPNSNGATDCSNWSVNASWKIPEYACPGWYWVLLKGANGSDFGQMIFCVSDKLSKRSMVVVGSDATWGGSYNYYGGKTAVTSGKSVYGSGGPVGGTGGITSRALCVSMDRPVVTRTGIDQTYFMNSEYPLLRFLERFGYDVGYATLEQVDSDPSILDGRSVVLFSGHNEYISQTVLNKTRELTQSGTNLVNMASNDFFWRVRYGTLDDTQTTTKGRVIWCRKDTVDGPGGHIGGTAFVNDAEWTGTWQDTRWPLRDPSSNIWGDIFVANGLNSDEVTVGFTHKSLPIWRDIPSIASLAAGQTYSFGVGSVGFEWDKPAGMLPHATLSSRTYTLNGNASDVNGQDYSSTENATHSVQMIKTPSGGYIANFSSAQWGWTLDNFHDRGTSIATVEAQQATFNVLADLGALPDAGRVTTEGAGRVYPTAVASIATSYHITMPTHSAQSGTWQPIQTLKLQFGSWQNEDTYPSI